jgi:RNA polymerase sigma-70 factor (ECF subfamily)
MSNLMAAEDQEHLLTMKARTGDRGAFEELVIRNLKKLESLISSRLGARLRLEADVDDILQETFLWAFKSIERFQWQGEGSFCRWLAGIAEHVILNTANRHERHGKLQLTRDVRGESRSPSKGMRQDERFDRFQKAIDGLSPEHKQVILLARIDALPVKEIAKRMNRSPDAIMQLLSRALRKLRKLMGETESFHLPDRTLRVEGSRDAER